jgi:hypothetical protein
MRSVATPTWSPCTLAARWHARRRRVGGHRGPQLGRDLRCDMVHRPVRWQTWGSTAEAGRRGWQRTHRQRGCSGGGRGRRWSRRSPRLRERVRRSICSSNGMNNEPGWPEAELAKNGDGGGDLSRPGLLRCRGGGPREVAEDEGLPVLLGDRSVRTKGSTGRVAVWHTEAEEEKGRGGGVQLIARKRGGGSV